MSTKDDKGGASSIRADGKRNTVYPADVKGRFTRGRQLFFPVLIAIYASLPLIPIGGHPAVFLDIEQRRFYLFGLTGNAQDVWLMFFVLSGVGFALVVATALFGRLWCGYACPQTVFLEGVYRRFERWIEGPREKRKRRDQGPWNLDKVWRKVLKHAVYATATLGLVHIFLSYFVSIPGLWRMIGDGPAAHPTAFGTMLVMSVVIYGNFAWFREQTCVVICPYGRLQSVLTDSNSLIIGYDTLRGEPRGKKSDPNAADCVDCGRCVAVCPTGIDIRNGLQLDCIGCAACIDACDEIMTKVKRPTGLIRYDSLNGLQRKPKRFLRPRVWMYAALGLLGLVVAFFSMRTHQPYEANILRLKGVPYELVEGKVKNSFELHIVNKSNAPVTYELVPDTSAGGEFVLAKTELTLESMEGARIPVFVSIDEDLWKRGLKVRVEIRPGDGGPTQTASARFAGPG
jgi:cytochrome c oxidase accessory protein FixG